MKSFEYENYDSYIRAQIAGNIQNQNGVWVTKNSIQIIVEYIKNNQKEILLGICHGVRTGYEVSLFKEAFPTAKIIGTEISPNAANFINVIQWDFHKVKEEWKNNIDFIYSNALDHSYNPRECIDGWMSCVKKDGLCFIEWSWQHAVEPNERDPFGASLEEYRKLFSEKHIAKCELEADLKRVIFVIAHR